MMRPFGLRRFVSLYLVLLASTSMVTWVIVTPPRFEQYASISVLSQRLTASNYFPGNTSTVEPGQPVSWNIQVYNHMGAAQLLLLIVRLSNETIAGPDATTNSPSSGTALLELTRATLNDETWTVPLQWSVINITQTNQVAIQIMQVNSATIGGINVSSPSGKNFRIIVELWTYDIETHSFIFSFKSDGAIRIAWNQLWFDVS